MQIVKGIDLFHSVHHDRVYLALGNFDGVHVGHREIIRTTVDLAKEQGKKSAILLFFPHPLSILHPQHSPELLITMEDRIAMLGEAGIDYVIIHPFTRDFAALSPEQFAREILRNKLSVAGVVVGFDYSFGSRGSGKPTDLQAMGKQYDFSVQVIEPVTVQDEAVGSSAIRLLLTQGNVEKASAMLGYPYYVRGTVVHGDGRGRTLGFPTANLQLPPEVIRPANGVYLAKVAMAEQMFWALTNVGTRPTFHKNETSVEVFLLDTKKNLYYEELIVYFIQRMREEKSFIDAAALIKQIQNDVR
ncbi:MAG: bifunctional riboflavin kinase/FAD synthetase, partial [Firmicutes bacterium]|nr:bifunctional riboflavin kinase/FAD synthetase [Bacillota bacterium]